MNFVRTWFLILLLTATGAGIGYWIDAELGAEIGGAVAFALNLFGYFNAGRMVIAMHGAEMVDDKTAPALHALVTRMAARAALPVPRLYIVQEFQPNAFVLGRNAKRARIVVTTGLVDRLNENQIVGVLAHEFGHIRRGDTLPLTFTAALAGAIGVACNLQVWRAILTGRGGNAPVAIGPAAGLLMLLTAPLAALLIHIMVGRGRIYDADHIGASLIDDPLWLADALRVIQDATRRIPNPTAEANAAAAHLYIESPLRPGLVASLFASHPPTFDRIERLEALARLRRADLKGGTGGHATSLKPRVVSLHE